jgi:hypothetical protein
MFWINLLVCLLKCISSEYVEFPVSPDFDLGWEIKGDIVEFTYKVSYI